ncbi:predicted transcriptional regulator [Aeropyrum camini SY1 = JCM 12091]|uniref:Predicted transcriptional regulator n=3 Tax=Aeropyrum camini TaxID=229980 RepID=U3TBL3_9CREN|nr:predicted transcriptional regulator [Aeropyrum camini SY1 = JCM 12091]
MSAGNHMEVDVTSIPVKPTSAKEVRELEIALIIGTLLRPDVIQEILHPREFTTWVDSLAVAAGALARDKAGYPIPKIAEELGRSETTIRNHLQGKTKAGQLVRETYDMIKTGKLKITMPTPECEETKKKLETVKVTLKDLLEKL